MHDITVKDKYVIVRTGGATVTVYLVPSEENNLVVVNRDGDVSGATERIARNG